MRLRQRQEAEELLRGQEADQPWTWSARLFAVLAAAAIVGALAAGVLSYGESSSIAPMAGKVWSPEHGHYHYESRGWGLGAGACRGLGNGGRA